MPINSIDNSNLYGYTSATQAAKTAAAEKEDNNTQETESKYTPDVDTIRTMKADLKGNVAAFKQMVSQLLGEQGKFSWQSLASLTEVDEATQKRAQAAIAEDGYWGVEQTATRILDFAKALSGGDESKIELLQAAVLAGFEAAEKTWGGELPGIAYQTKERILQGFDEWRASFAAPAEE